MKTKQRLVNLAFVSSMILLILLPLGVSAETGSEDNVNGSLQMQIDRILQDKDGNNEYRETELEKIFPSLFTSETAEQINAKEEEQENKMGYLEENLFSKEIDENVAIEEVKDSLFNSDYTSVAASGGTDEEESNSSFSNIILMAFTGVAVVLCGGLYVLMQRLLD